MPDLDDNLGLEHSSDEANLDADLDIRGEGPVVGDNGAESSDAQIDEGQERTSLDVVQDVVKARDPATGSSPDAEKEGEKADQTGAQGAKEQDDEKFTDVPFHKHPRFQQLLKQRDSLKVAAERMGNIEAFLDHHGVKTEEASNVLTILAQSKTDPVSAWAALKPMVQQLLVDAGEVLTHELRARVNNGELSEEAAFEIAKANARGTSAQRAQETAAERQERERQQEHVKSLRDTGNAWAADRATKDPNFKAKESLIKKEVVWLNQTQGLPKTPAEVRARLEEAYANVNKEWRPARAAAPSVGQATRRPSIGGSASTTRKPASEAEPAGALKFIKAAVASRNGAAA